MSTRRSKMAKRFPLPYLFLICLTQHVLSNDRSYLISSHYIRWIILIVGLLYMVMCSESNSDRPNTGHTLFVNCETANDTSDCGVERVPCKTLQFAVQQSIRKYNSTYHINISINAGTCKERGVLNLDCRTTATKSWEFVGANTDKPPGQATIIQLPAKIINCSVKFSYLHWQNISELVSFNTFRSEITFKQVVFGDSNIFFTGINTNLSILDMLVQNCTSGDHDLPIFLLQITYSHKAELFISNSKYSKNLSPAIYVSQLSRMSIINTAFLGNNITASSNGSLVTILDAQLVMLRDSRFEQTLGPVIDIKYTRNVTARNVTFASNKGSKGSCFLIKRFNSNITLVNSVFEENANPVIYVEDKDVNITVKNCQFGCKTNNMERKSSFIEAPDGTNIVSTNCTIDKSCSGHCKNGELLKSHLFCQKCEPGSFSFSLGNNVTSTTCQSCPLGTYTSTSANPKCTLCPEGTYTQKVGSTKCKKCSNEFFTSSAGAKSCLKMTLELILVLVASTPLMVIPLFILVGRYIDSKRKPRRTQNRYKELPTVK